MVINKTENILNKLELQIAKYRVCSNEHKECNEITNLIQECIDKKIQFTNDLIQKIISRTFHHTNYCINNPIVRKKLENFISYVTTLSYNSILNLMPYVGGSFNFIDLYLMKKTTKLSSFDYCNILKNFWNNKHIMSLLEKYDHVYDITYDIIEVASIHNIIFILEKIIIDKIKVDNKIFSNILFVKNLSFANKLIDNGIDGTDITVKTLENLFLPPINLADNTYDSYIGYSKKYPYRKLNESVEFILDKKIKPSELAFSNMLLYFGEYRFARQKISKSIIKNLKDEQLENYKNSGKCLYNSDANEIINLFIGAGYIIKYKDFILAVKAGVEINDIERFDIKFDDNFTEECSKAGFFPYNIKYKPSLGLLRNECLKPKNHSNVIKLCETINPDIICLRNACSTIETSKTIDYLLEKKIKPDIMCLLNICKSSTSSSIRKLASVFLDNLSDDQKKILEETNNVFVVNNNTQNDKHEESCTDIDTNNSDNVSIISESKLVSDKKSDSSESSNDYEELVKNSDDSKSQDGSTESSNDYDELVEKSDDSSVEEESSEEESSEEESSEEESSEEESSDENNSSAKKSSDENNSSAKKSSEDYNSSDKKGNIKKTIIKHPIRKETDKKKDLSNGDIKIVKKSLINKDIVIISDSESEEEIKEKPSMDTKIKKMVLQKKKDIISDSESEKKIKTKKTKKEINHKHDETSSELPKIEKQIKPKYEEIPNEYEFKSLILINDKQAEFLGCKTKEIDHIEIKKKLLTLIKSKNLFDKKDKMKVIFIKDQMKLINFPDDNMLITDIDKMIYTYFVKNSKTI